MIQKNILSSFQKFVKIESFSGILLLTATIIAWIGKRMGRSTMVPTQPLKVDVLRGCNMSFRKIAFGKFDDKLKGYWGFEDEVCFQIKNNGYDIIADPEIKVHHFVAPITAEYSRGKDKKSVISANHNNTYISLKHFTFIRSIIFLLYTFILGDQHYLGIIRYLLFIIKTRKISFFKQLVWSLEGKLYGIMTFIKS